MLTIPQLDAQKDCLETLQSRCGSRPDITAQLKDIASKRRTAVLEKAQKPREGEKEVESDETC